MAQFALTVNGRRVEVDAADPDMPLLWVLRDRLGLTGTKFGCGMGVCGACTVLASRRGRALLPDADFGSGGRPVHDDRGPLEGRRRTRASAPGSRRTSPSAATASRA